MERGEPVLSLPALLAAGGQEILAVAGEGGLDDLISNVEEVLALGVERGGAVVAWIFRALTRLARLFFVMSLSHVHRFWSVARVAVSRPGIGSPPGGAGAPV